MARCRLRPSLAFLGLLVGAACGGEAPKPRGEPSQASPGVVLVIVDTLRADGIGIEGEGPGPMPAMRAWAKGATAFADAFAPAPWTPQSVPSILTGLTPPHHGCDGSAETGVPALPGAVTTLAERLKSCGYSTTAFTSGGYFSVAQGLFQGVDHFAEALDTEGPEACVDTWLRLRPAGRPFLLVLHTYLVHDPYGPKDPKALVSAAAPRVPASPTIQRVLSDPGRSPTAPLDPDTLRECAIEWLTDGWARPANNRLTTRRSASDFLPTLGKWISGGYLADPTGRVAVEARLRASYVGGLGIVDAFLARLFTALDGARLPADTITIVASDHGEAFGEHGYLTHQRHLYDELLHVPLLVRAPGRMPVGAVIRGTCGPVDVMPTILDLLGLPIPPALDGRSLVPLANGKERGHPVFATADRYEVVGGGPRAVRELQVRDATRAWSYVYDVATGERIEERVFDLATDPRRLVPLPVTSVDWREDELCALVTASRDEARTRFGLAPLGSPCKPRR